MSGRRVGLRNRYAYGLGAAARALHLDVSAGPPTVATCALPPPAPTPPVRHAVITPQHSTWYRVLRGFKGHLYGSYGVNWEAIGEFPTQLEAMVFARTEAGHAVVNDWHSKVVFRNSQAIEVREPEGQP